MQSRFSLSDKAVIIIGVVVFTAFAEKELMYDPVKGIVFVDKNSAGSISSQNNDASVEKKRVEKKTKADGANNSDIHIGRKKDPPDLYFKSGLEYYKNNDFNNAIKNFQFADSLEHHAVYALLIGKTLRKLGKMHEMIKVMYDIVKDEADSDVADDALLELALFYKMDDDYDKAMLLFTKITEVYPFGTEYATGEETADIAREQRRLMRAEMINLLTTLGFSGEDLQAGYRNFQKARGLPVTEAGDRATIKALREMHRTYVQQADRKATRQQRANRFTGWIYGAVAAGGINLILLLVLFVKTQSHQRHISELMKIVSDLDIKKL